MDHGLFRNICEQLDTLGFSRISLSGGEPTLLKDLDKYVEIASEFKFTTRLNTSGILLPPERLSKLVDAGLHQLVLSLYGIESTDVVGLRGNKVLARQLPSTLETLRIERQRNRLIVFIQTAVQRQNFRLLPSLLEKAFHIKADVFWPSFLENAVNSPPLRIEAEDDLKYLEKEVIPGMKSVVLLNTDPGPHQNYLLNQCEKISHLREYAKGVYRSSLPPNCNNAGNFVLIYPDGRMAPCQGCEYFDSGFDSNIELINISEFITNISCSSFKKEGHSYCHYCPHGQFIEMRLNPEISDETQRFEGALCSSANQ